MNPIHRRSFLTLLGTSAAAWPLGTGAQQQRNRHRIGILETIPPELNTENLNAFKDGLKNLGYIEGQNVSFEYRSANGQSNLFPSLVTDLLRSNVDLLITRGTPAVLAAKRATSTIPIVMSAIGEPLLAVNAIARPGENVTGLSAFVTELQAKRVELLKDLLPSIARVGALLDMSNPVSAPQWAEIDAAARTLGLTPQLFDVRTQDGLSKALEAANQQRMDALVVGIDTLTQANPNLIAELAIKYKLPTIYASKEFVEAGGLIMYGVSYPALYRRAAAYVDKIFKGERPGELPVEQPTKLELIINSKTAKAIGVTFPPSIMLRVDEVIE